MDRINKTQSHEMPVLVLVVVVVVLLLVSAQSILLVDGRWWSS